MAGRTPGCGISTWLRYTHLVAVQTPGCGTKTWLAVQAPGCGTSIGLRCKHLFAAQSPISGTNSWLRYIHLAAVQTPTPGGGTNTCYKHLGMVQTPGHILGNPTAAARAPGTVGPSRLLIHLAQTFAETPDASTYTRQKLDCTVGLKSPCLPFVPGSGPGLAMGDGQDQKRQVQSRYSRIWLNMISWNTDRDQNAHGSQSLRSLYGPG